MVNCTVLIAGIIVLLIFSAAIARAGQVDYLEVEIDGAVVRCDAQRQDDQVRLHHELAGLSMGSHTARVRGANGWGIGEWSDPFGFAAQLPGKVSGLGLSAE